MRLHTILILSIFTWRKSFHKPEFVVFEELNFQDRKTKGQKVWKFSKYLS